MFRFLRQVYRLTRPKKGRFALGIICGILAGLADPAMLAVVVLVLQIVFPSSQTPAVAQPDPEKIRHQPWLQEHLHRMLHQAQTFIVDQAQRYLADHHSAWVLAAIIAVIPVLMLARCVVLYLYGYLMSWVVVRAIADLRTRAFEHLLNLPLSFFGATSTGELMSRVGDINILQNVMTSSVMVLVKEPVQVMALTTALFATEWKLTLWAAVFCPLFIIPISIYSKKGRKSAGAAQTNAAGLSRLMHESFAGNRIIKAYNLERVVSQQFRAETAKLIGHFMRVVRSTETPGPLIEFMGSVGAAILLFYFAVQPKASAGDFATFVFIIFWMYRPIKALVRLHSQLVQARGATQRIFDLLATESTLIDPPQPVPFHAANAPILFDNVSFSYGDKLVLRNVCLSVEPGQMVALVGRSGSGKTTLTNLLLRFYDPTEGAIRIGGVDLRQAAVRGVRSQMAVVTQEIILFNDTIRHNIALGRPGATDAEIEEAARQAFAHEFIVEKPRGYESVVGEKGTNLSGGQRQRIAIARAILKDAPILVLDEATSSLDNESERAVQVALDQLMKGRTTICIAHRLSTVQHADLIVVLDQGRIVETGRHAELLARGGVYYKLHALGFQ
ncbi:MAG: ABC transporter ATP-binding protein [Verrucomicrobiota bacterium]|jgi:subfamily B ATP-binding cassette protein MsbA